MSESRWRGRRLVTVIYVLLVALTAVFGLVIGLIRPDDIQPVLFGLVELPPTPLGLAVYGAVTVAVVLGVLLLAVSVVAERYDTHDVEE